MQQRHRNDLLNRYKTNAASDYTFRVGVDNYTDNYKL